MLTPLDDIERLTARAQWWSGWCIDNEESLPDLVEVRRLLDAVVDHLKNERDARNAPEGG